MTAADETLQTGYAWSVARNWAWRKNAPLELVSAPARRTKRVVYINTDGSATAKQAFRREMPPTLVVWTAAEAISRHRTTLKRKLDVAARAAAAPPGYVESLTLELTELDYLEASQDWLDR
jgi:hypothetical protein